MDLLLAALILGFCGALPCPIKVASCPLRRSRGWGEGVACVVLVWTVYS